MKERGPEGGKERKKVGGREERRESGREARREGRCLQHSGQLQTWLGTPRRKDEPALKNPALLNTYYVPTLFTQPTETGIIITVFPLCR